MPRLLSTRVSISPPTPRQAKLEERQSRQVSRVPRKPQEQQVPSLAEMVTRLQLEPPRHPLDEQVEVVGETYHVKGIKRVFGELGMPITDGGSTLERLECILVPEPWNPHDPNAVAVMVGTHQVGHIPADLAEEYAPGLGALAGAGQLATGKGRIWAKDDGGMVGRFKGSMQHKPVAGRIPAPGRPRQECASRVPCGAVR